MTTIKNYDVLHDNSLINTGRFMLHGNLKSPSTIQIDTKAPAAAFSAEVGSITAKPIEDFLDGNADTYLLAVGFGITFGGQLLLGKRPENISVSPNKYTISGGRCSENPATTGFKELAEEFVILATNGDEQKFVRFVPHLDCVNTLSKEQISELQTHAVESLSYAEQALATHWIDGVIRPIWAADSVTLKVTDEDNNRIADISGCIPCVIDEIKTVDILVPHELHLPAGWTIKECFFLENPDKTCALKNANEWADGYDLTQWASTFVRLNQ